MHNNLCYSNYFPISYFMLYFTTLNSALYFNVCIKVGLKQSIKYMNIGGYFVMKEVN